MSEQTTTPEGLRRADGVPCVEAYLAIERAREYLQSEVALFFKEFDLSPQQYNALRIIWHRASDEGIPSLAIAHRLLNRVPDITRLLDRLMRDGLIERRRSRKDRRVVLVTLTPAGLAKLQEVDVPLRQLHERAFAHMSDGELNTMMGLLDKVRARPE